MVNGIGSDAECASKKFSGSASAPDVTLKRGGFTESTVKVRESLSALGVQGMTVTEVKGYGRQKGHTEIYRGAEYAVSFLPKLKIELAVKSEMADAVIEAITSKAKTGQIGDGKIFVTPLEQVVRIRTGETDGDAL